MRGVLFDKDGTLFDFHASWGVWARKMLLDLSQGDQSLMHKLADSLRFDLASARFHPDSFVIADTPAAVALVLADELPHSDVGEVLDKLNAAAEQIALVEAAPLVPLVLELEARGLSLAVVTNDAESPARTHLADAGILHAFDAVIGFDSGFGAKPAPGPLLACAKQMGLDPARVVSRCRGGCR
jgi:phosphoglycolate phosphatase